MKKICIFLSCCLLLCTVLTYPASSDRNPNDCFIDGGLAGYEVSLPYTPPGRGEGTGASIQSVIGAFDERRDVDATQSPYCKIVFIRAFYPDDAVIRGTGVIIGPDLILTCAHLVYREQHGGMAEYCRVYTGVNGTRPDIDAGLQSIDIVLPDEWIDGDAVGNDWAYIIVDTPIGHTPIGYTQGWMGFGTVPTNYSEQFTISGYPDSAPYHNDHLNYTMYTESGVIMPEANGKMFQYRIDATEGNSGSPVYSSNQIVYGIHVNGSNTEPFGYNKATRISSDLYQQLVDEKNASIEYWEEHGY